MADEAEPQGRKRGGKKRGRRKTGSGTMRASTQVKNVEKDLARAVRSTYVELFGRRTDHTSPFSFSVQVRVDPLNGWKLTTEPPLEDQIRAAVREMSTRLEVFQNGRVYCYRCESSLCQHSVPPEPGCVFGGYASTGRPLWPELVQVLLEMKNPGVDTLYNTGRHDLVVAFMDRDSLRQRQLNVFGRESRTYDILGQIVFGFLSMDAPGAVPPGRDRVAFTVQAVGYMTRNGAPRLGLNVLGRLSDGHAAVDAVHGPYQSRIFDIIASTRRRVATLAPLSYRRGEQHSPKKTYEKLEQDVTSHLRNLARSLEKTGRQRDRRTTHAEGRRTTRKHTSNALRDAASAREGFFLWDEKRRTVVVVGPRNRVHVFSPEARHVTSLLLKAEEVQSRRRRKRWIPFTGEPLQTFREAVERASRGGRLGS